MGVRPTQKKHIIGHGSNSNCLIVGIVYIPEDRMLRHTFTRISVIKNITIKVLNYLNRPKQGA